MTKEKKQKVKVKVVNVKIGSKKSKETKDTFLNSGDKKEVLNGFLDSLKGVIEEVSNEMGLRTKEPHNYYAVFAYEKDGKLCIGHTSFCTNLNVYNNHGHGMDMLASKFKIENNISSDVHILNVIKLED